MNTARLAFFEDAHRGKSYNSKTWDYCEWRKMFTIFQTCKLYDIVYVFAKKEKKKFYYNVLCRKTEEIYT